ncbi:APC family permease [Granulicella cerasi]|uniref:APC family permease n=1 Tax=Granulicella cerasi TaxID=741063 RepID=A0ABW1ZFF6_9BACT|nr:APC family permease [Granulicella cerasi]
MTDASPNLHRSLSPRGALTLNLLDMIGVGPFLTLPLLVAAMGGPQAMLGWILGALLAACDGLVWAELGAAMPHAGGTYRYLAEMFPGKWGRWLSFLFVFQLCFSAPLSIASGCIGLAQYAGFIWPSFASQASVHALHLGAYTVGTVTGKASLLAVVAVVVATTLQMRSVGALRGLATFMLGVVLLTIFGACVTGALRGHWSQIVAFPPHAFAPNHTFFLGLGSAMLVATYDYWGYYNVTFLGAEVRDPQRTIPRALLGSIAIVAVLYLALNASVLSVMGSDALLKVQTLGERRAMLSTFMVMAWQPVVGSARAYAIAVVAAVCVMITAFASVFALLLGYSRIPYAAARDGNFLRSFAKLDSKGDFPVVSLLALALVACACCFLSLADVIAGLVVLRILLQFMLQHVGVMLWRKRVPDAPRPFRVWLYPLPPVLALVGFGYVVLSRAHFAREVIFAAVIAVLGTIVFLLRRKTSTELSAT